MLVGNVYLNKTHISVDLIRDLQQELIFRLERDKETWSQFFRPIWALKLKGHNQSEHSHMQRERISIGVDSCLKKNWPSNAADVQKEECQIIQFLTGETADQILYL